MFKTSSQRNPSELIKLLKESAKKSGIDLSSQYLEEVQTVISSQTRPNYEVDSLSLDYSIGKTPQEDIVKRNYVIDVKKPTVYCERVHIGATPSSGKISSFDKLNLECY